MSTLLDLPPLVREDIFSKVLVDPARTDTSLLRVCKQFHNESKPLLFRRPLIFRTQHDLYNWMQLVTSEWYKLVISLHIGITDVIDQSLRTAVEHSCVNTWDQYHADAQKNFFACLQFPNVVDYTLEPLFEIRTDEQHEYLQLLLSRIPIQWPMLERIRFGSAGQKLSWLKSMPDLRMISSTGFSGSTPMETVTILSRLRHLTDLELEWPPRVHTAAGELTNNQIAKSGIKNQSFTRETIKGFRGLRRIRIHERKTLMSDPAAYFNNGFLQALDSSHRASLRTFEADLNFAPSPAAERSIFNLLHLSSLRNIDLHWPGFNEQLLDFLPPSVVTLRIPPCPPRLEPYCLLVLAANRDKLPCFRYMSVARSKDLDTDAVSTQRSRRISRSCTDSLIDYRDASVSGSCHQLGCSWCLC